MIAHHVHLLGGVEFDSPSAARELLSRPGRIALLAWLAAHAQTGPRQRDEIIGLFWPESGEDNARTSLRQALHLLRRALGDDAILNRGTALQLNTSAVSCDVVHFDRAVRNGHDADAIRLYRGHFLDGMIVPGAYDVMEWIALAQRRRREHAIAAAIRVAERAMAAGDLHLAVRTVQRAADLLPPDDRLHARLDEIARAAQGVG
ncbi:MAG: hypothetical protein IT355_05950 [Gemmatimonadaceae bacterium]|nr:hypothetical protein [Gemmatimonadaceae bacterium]